MTENERDNKQNHIVSCIFFRKLDCLLWTVKLHLIEIRKPLKVKTPILHLLITVNKDIPTFFEFSTNLPKIMKSPHKKCDGALDGFFSLLELSSLIYKMFPHVLCETDIAVVLVY